MQQAAQRTKKSKVKTTVWGSATAMSSVRTHAPGATPGGMHLDHAFVAWGGKSLLGSRWSARQAALCHHICSMLNKNIREPRETGKLDNSSNIRQFHKVGYKDAKTWMERINSNEVRRSQLGRHRVGGRMAKQPLPRPYVTDLNKGVAEIKATNLARHYTCWHVPCLGQMVQQ